MRPGWQDYWVAILDNVASRGTCDRKKCGALIVDGDNQVIATGYNGAPRGLPHCDEVGHLIHKIQYADGSVSHHCVRTAHAERNAIIQAARRGISVVGSTMYCTTEPCINCAVDIINAGIKRVVAQQTYHRAELSREWLKQANVALEVLNRSE